VDKAYLVLYLPSRELLNMLEIEYRAVLLG
jgi:hypothetical protein